MPPFVHRIRVRYNECDAQGAVFNANFLVYFDVAITELWREAFGSYDDALEQHGQDLMVAEAHVRYLKPARFDDELDVVLTVEKLSNTAMTTSYDVMRRDDKIAQGTTRHVFVDLAKGTKSPIPDPVRTKLETYGSQRRMSPG